MKYARHIILLLFWSWATLFLLKAEDFRPFVLLSNRTENAPRIDGRLDDACWESSINVWEGYFIQSSPSNGRPSSQQSRVQVLYDDRAVYIGAMLYDNSPDSILTELGLRDEIGKNTDEFAVAFDTYYQQQNAFFFRVSAAGVQIDYFQTPNGRDYNWNAVWKSAVRVHDCGWSVEMEIPYSAIRFPRQKTQNWGLNFFRQIQRHQEESWWHPIDPNKNGVVNQFGTLEGIEDIQPPLRLQLTPYLTGYLAQSEPGAPLTPNLTGGMDLKLGINESYTLDMSLVPDFGQVRSDNIVYNLSPFEVQLAENRPFFTEGTELFQRGPLFYSRRVGTSFGITGGIGEHEVVLSTPTEAPLLNAAKISGRNSKGLGIGIFNALTRNTWATVQDTLSGQTRQVLADPLTNFNMLVVDQNLKNNSNIAFANTSVLRSGQARDAIVSAVEFSFFDRENLFNVRGNASLSQIFSTSPEGGTHNEVGHRYFLEAGKVSGRFQFRLSRLVESHNYETNDLGFLRAPNEVTHSAGLSYVVNEPVGIFNRYSSWVSSWHTQLHKPREYDNWGGEVGAEATFRNFWNTGLEIGGSPSVVDDHFEARTGNQIFKKPPSVRASFWMNSDSRKALAFGANAGVWRRPEWQQLDNWLGFNPRFRINNHFTLEHSLNLNWRRREIGYATKLYEEGALTDIILGKRYVFTSTNTFGGSYTFNEWMGLNLRVRHYWSRVDYVDFFRLENSGLLASSDYTGVDKAGEPIHDVSFNAFNIDLVYNWQFAPGSMMSLVWKNAIYTQDNNPEIGYFENFRYTLQSPMVNSLSIRVLYFLDYLELREWVKEI